MDSLQQRVTAFSRTICDLWLNTQVMLEDLERGIGLAKFPDREAEYREWLEDLERHAHDDYDLLVYFRRARLRLEPTVEIINNYPSYHDLALFTAGMALTDTKNAEHTAEQILTANTAWNLDWVERKLEVEQAMALEIANSDPVPPVPVIPAVKFSLNDSEQSVCEAINRLWDKGLQWPGNADIYQEAGLDSEDACKKITGPLARHGVLDKGPSGRGFKVRT